MPTVTTIRVDGLRELGERMRKLNTKVATRSCARATGAAAKLVKEAAKTNIRTSPSVETGSLLNAVIVKKLGKSQTALTSEHIVTVRRRKTGGKKSKSRQQTAPHARFIEYGTKTERGSVRTPAEPFLRPALDQNIERAKDAMKQKLTDEIIKGEA